jgi:hypothetical protein
VPELWVPGVEGPHDELVSRLHRLIARFAQEAGVERASVVVELESGARFALDSISPEPGFGFVTLRPHPEEDLDVPAELVVPVAALRRIELDAAEDQRARFGFSLPDPA